MNSQESPVNSHESVSHAKSSSSGIADSSLSVLEDIMLAEENVTSLSEKPVGDFVTSTPKSSKRKSDDEDSNQSLLDVAFTDDFDDAPYHYENAQRMPSLCSSLENMEQPQSGLTTTKKNLLCGEIENNSDVSLLTMPPTPGSLVIDTDDSVSAPSPLKRRKVVSCCIPPAIIAEHECRRLLFKQSELYKIAST